MRPPPLNAVLPLIRLAHEKSMDHDRARTSKQGDRKGAQ